MQFTFFGKILKENIHCSSMCVALSKREFSLLKHLVSSLNHVWGKKDFGREVLSSKKLVSYLKDMEIPMVRPKEKKR